MRLSSVDVLKLTNKVHLQVAKRSLFENQEKSIIITMKLIIVALAGMLFDQR